MNEHKERFDAIFPPAYAEEDEDTQSDDTRQRMLEHVRGCLAGALLLVARIEDADPDLVLAVAGAHNLACKALGE